MDDETKEQFLREVARKGHPLPPGTTKENMVDKLLEAAKDGQEPPRYAAYPRAIQGRQPTFVDDGEKAYYEVAPKALHGDPAPEGVQTQYLFFALHDGRWCLELIAAQPPE